MTIARSVARPVAGPVARSVADTVGGSPALVQLADDFNRADAASLGANWTELRADSGFSIVTNRAVARSDSAVAPIDRYDGGVLSGPPYYAEVEALSAQLAGVGIGFGGANPDDGYIFRARNNTSSTYRLFTLIDGTLTQIAVVSTTSPGSAYVVSLEITAAGEMIGRINGNQVITHTDTQIALGGKAAISASASQILDNFSGEVLT